MCRSIVTLRKPEPASDEEVNAAALQFVRKVSGYRQPSRANAEAFERAVSSVAASVRELLDDLPLAKTAAAPARSARTDRPAAAAPRRSTDVAAAR